MANPVALTTSGASSANMKRIQGFLWYGSAAVGTSALVRDPVTLAPFFAGVTTSAGGFSLGVSFVQSIPAPNGVEVATLNSGTMLIYTAL